METLKALYFLRIPAIILLVVFGFILIPVFSKHSVYAFEFSPYTSNVGIGESAPSDTTLPQTSITNPLSGSLVSGNVSYTASASDNVGVTKVEFYVDSSLIGISSSAPYSTNWNTTTYSNNFHSLFTKAFDAAGNVGTSYSFSVTVDNTAPFVSLTNPANGSLLSGSVNLSASATDNNSVSRVEFYVDNNNIGTSYSSPYSAIWNSSSVADGSHSIYAKAFDKVNNQASSSAISVTVDNNPPTVSLTSPVNGSFVSGLVNVVADAFDSVGVSKVEFYVDGNLIGVDTVAPYFTSWDTTGFVHNSTHTLSAKAYDGAGHVTSSSSTAVTVLDITAPNVNITNPLNGSTVPRNTTIAIKANVSDISGISKVEFRVNGTLKCTDTSSPYSCNWKIPTTKNKLYTLEAKAFDIAGNTATNTITVTSSR